MPNSLNQQLESALKKREISNSLRQLKTITGLIDFCSNDYLGLSRSEELYKQIKDDERSLHNRTNGSTGSRLISGNSELAEALEKQLATIFRSESTLLFNSGYNANLAILSAVPQKGDVIVYDELCHASIKDGIRLSHANKYSFKHNDLVDLERHLTRESGKHIYVVVESVYSMDGDKCDVGQLVEICEKQGANLIIDEAHSTGAIGENGGGMSLNFSDRIFARVFTFGKAMGVHGACVAGNDLLIKYLINFARPFIYTTAMSDHSLLSIKCAFEYLSHEIELQQLLKQKVDLFAKEMQEQQHFVNQNLNQGPIQALLTPGNVNAKNIANQLISEGYDVRPILSPTVKEGTERIRICLHAFNSDEEINGLVKSLKLASL